MENKCREAFRQSIADSYCTGLMKKLAEMKKYLENDEVDLLTLMELTLAKLEKTRNAEFGALELIQNFDA